jgi:hypothetical protein
MSPDTRAHLIAWLERYEHEPARFKTYSRIIDFLEAHPDVIHLGHSWSSIRTLAERFATVEAL